MILVNGAPKTHDAEQNDSTRLGHPDTFVNSLVSSVEHIAEWPTKRNDGIERAIGKAGHVAHVDLTPLSDALRKAKSIRVLSIQFDLGARKYQ